jgi:hypothetical protein
MAGGYGRNIDDTVAVHLQTVALARQYQSALASRLGVRGKDRESAFS